VKQDLSLAWAKADTWAGLLLRFPLGLPLDIGRDTRGTAAPSGPPLSSFWSSLSFVQGADDFSFLFCVGSTLVSSWPRSFSTWLIQFANCAQGPPGLFLEG